jgi:hypothetical protein
MAVHVSGHYAYVGGGGSWHSARWGWLDVVDISNPTSPVLVGSIGLPDVVKRVRVKDGLAYVAADFSGLLIVDVTNPTSPTLRGSCIGANYAIAVSVSGSFAYIAGSRWNGTTEIATLRIIDVSNPSSPTLRVSYDLPIFDYQAYDVFVSGGLAFVADGSLRIVDVTNPLSPVLRSSWGSGIRNVFVSNGVAYVTTTFGTFACIDVTSPGAPRLLGSYATAGGGGPLYVSGRYAYVGLGNGLHIFDISNPSAPTLCGFYPAWADVFVSGSLVYVTWGDLLILQFAGAAAANHWQLYR